ncbi:hypothetical protein ACH5RR_015786 [Cinchona calisaya]|uniref:Uncharacterized protein n=1 Tax=Cinchona calisaya TaxID=153742 RepID=A0ABD2ZWT6_9GENT
MVSRGFSPVEDLRGIVICSHIWVLWENRNRIVFDGVAKDPFSLVSFATHYVSEFRAVNLKPQSEVTNQVESFSSWQPCSNGRLRMNYDVAIFQDQGCCGLGLYSEIVMKLLWLQQLEK